MMPALATQCHRAVPSAVIASLSRAPATPMTHQQSTTCATPRANPVLMESGFALFLFV
jgi:hypothetical protein